MTHGANPPLTGLGRLEDDAAPALLRRRATVVAGVLGPMSALVIGLIAFAAGEIGLLAWSAVGVIAGIGAVVQVTFHREDPAMLMLIVAAGVALGAPIAPDSSLPGVVAAVATGTIVILASTETHRRALVVALVVFSLLGFALVDGALDAGRFAGLVGLVAAGGGSWAVLERLVDSMWAGESGYRSLFDRVPVGLYRTGLGGELLEINPAMADLLGEPRESLIGRRAAEFFVDPEDFDRLRRTIGDAARVVTTDIRFLRADGEIIWVRDVTRPVADDGGRIRWFEGEIQDVTEQRRQVAELEALVTSKSELIGAISHELRTPLTAVLGFLEVLIDPDHVCDDDAKLLEVACSQARDLASIVDDLLTAARLDNRELAIRVEDVDLLDAITAASRSIDDAAADMEIAVPSGVVVVADAARTRQVLRNLIGNALRYGRPPFGVGVTLGEGIVEVVVSDHGPEIDEGVSVRMWESFFSGGEGETSRPGSIGLGLAVSRRLVTLMGGSLTYRRRNGRTEFVLALPRAGAELAA